MRLKAKWFKNCKRPIGQKNLDLKPKDLFKILNRVFKNIVLNLTILIIISGGLMATEPKKIGLYAVAGISIAALVIAAIFMSGIQFPGVAARTGTLVVLLTDAPVDLQSLNVTLSGLSVIGEEGELKLDFVSGTEFYIENLLALSGEEPPLAISTEEIPVGNYTKIRMNVTDAYAYYGEGDPRNTALKVPPGHIDVIAHFKIEENMETRITIDMEPDWVAISKQNTLRPVLKVESITVGSIEE